MPRNYPFQFWTVIANIYNINVYSRARTALLSLTQKWFSAKSGTSGGPQITWDGLICEQVLYDVAFWALEEENSKLVNADVDATISKGF